MPEKLCAHTITYTSDTARACLTDSVNSDGEDVLVKRANGSRRGRVVASSDSDVELVRKESAKERAGAHTTYGAALKVNTTADEESDELDVPLIQSSGSNPRDGAPLETPKCAREPLPVRASTRHKTESRGVGGNCSARPQRLGAQKNRHVQGHVSSSDLDGEAGAKRVCEDDEDYKEGADEDEDDEDEEHGEDDSDWTPSEGSAQKEAKILKNYSI